MSTPPIGEQVMLLPLGEDDLYQIVLQQLTVAFDSFEEDPELLWSVSRTLLSYLIDEAYDEELYRHRFARPLGVVVEQRLSDFAKKLYDMHQTEVARLIARLGLEERDRLIDSSSAELWDMSAEAYCFITQLIDDHKSGRLFIPPPAEGTT
jgi:hypothetical protein